MHTTHRKWLAGVAALCTLSLAGIGPVFGQAATGAAGGAGAPSGGTSGTSGSSGGGMTTGSGGSPTATPGTTGPTATPGTTAPSGTMTTPGRDSTSPSGTMGGTRDRGAMARSGRMSSDQVRSLQEALKQAGQDPGEIDGRMGPRTKKALVAYQRDQNLSSEREAWEKLGVDMAGSQGKAQRQ